MQAGSQLAKHLTVHCPEAQLGSIQTFLRKVNDSAEIVTTEQSGSGKGQSPSGATQPK